MAGIVKADKEPIEILAKWLVEHIKKSPKMSVAIRKSKICEDENILNPRTPYLWAKNGKLLEKMRELAAGDNAIAAFEIEQGAIEDARKGKDRGIYFKYIAKEPERIEHGMSDSLTDWILKQRAKDKQIG